MQKIGMDAGGTLTKIVYEENRQLHMKTYDTNEMSKLMEWLHMVDADADLYVTGGKSHIISEKTPLICHHIAEFDALISGTRNLLYTDQITVEKEYILVNIGTGTSIFHVKENEYDRMIGSGMGGGTILGLGMLLAGTRNFRDLMELAVKGNSKESDLLVKDLYANKTPILEGDLTAANFGSIQLHASSKADQVASLVQMIGENLLLLASQAAMLKKCRQIVFIGGALHGNKTLKSVLTGFQDMLPFEIIFLEKGSHAGALGAFLEE